MVPSLHQWFGEWAKCHCSGKSIVGRHFIVFPWYTSCTGRKSPLMLPQKNCCYLPFIFQTNNFNTFWPFFRHCPLKTLEHSWSQFDPSLILIYYQTIGNLLHLYGSLDVKEKLLFQIVEILTICNWLSGCSAFYKLHLLQQILCPAFLEDNWASITLQRCGILSLEYSVYQWRQLKQSKC